MATPEWHDTRSYGCTYACGRAYDVILISVEDGTTEFLCLPCLMKLVSDMLTAVLNPSSIGVQAKVKKAGTVTPTPMDGQGARPGRRNAPATTDDPDIFEAYDSRINPEDLPMEFR